MSGTKFVVKGGKPLRGEVEVRGSKNAATKMIVASFLTEEPCEIQNVPLSEDTEITVELARRIGSRVELNPESHVLKIETPSPVSSVVTELTRRNRVPVLALGPLLHRNGFAEVPVLGGCPIGHRPINFHMEALKKMGVRIERGPNSYYAEAKKIRGAEIELPFPSVGATENILLTATLAEGTTVVENAAVEPEIMNLVQMLRLMGAEILSDPVGRRFEISGVTRMRGARARVMPDRNEAVSFAAAAIATGGEVMVKGAEPGALGSFLEKLDEAGMRYKAGGEGIVFGRSSGYGGVSVRTEPHPGFMTDWASPFAVLLTRAGGESIIHETIYEDRFGYAGDLNRMGARISVSTECPARSPCRFFGRGFRHLARIGGAGKLKGGAVEMRDIRAGMSALVAALSAEGESVITGVEHIDRGYEEIDERLRGLGADIKRI